jgi:hypothetical protein
MGASIGIPFLGFSPARIKRCLDKTSTRQLRNVSVAQPPALSIGAVYCEQHQTVEIDAYAVATWMLSLQRVEFWYHGGRLLAGRLGATLCVCAVENLKMKHRRPVGWSDR